MPAEPVIHVKLAENDAIARLESRLVKGKLMRHLVASIAGFAIAIAMPIKTHAAEMPPPVVSSVTPEIYRIGVDDIVQVSVWRNPELGITVPVRPDGMISVPLIGDIPAGGHTPRDVAASIEARLANYVRDPQVAVILTELRSHEYLSRVRVTGAVRQPISIPYRQGMTVLDAVLAAGGVTEFAAPSRSNLYRKTDGVTKSYEIALDRILKRGDLSTNFDVAPGDVITIPERIL